MNYVEEIHVIKQKVHNHHDTLMDSLIAAGNVDREARTAVLEAFRNLSDLCQMLGFYIEDNTRGCC